MAATPLLKSSRFLSQTQSHNGFRTVNTESSAPQSLVDLLEQIEAKHPEALARQATREIDMLVGRDPMSPVAVPGGSSTRRRIRTKKSSRGVFDWYQAVLASVPPLDLEGTIAAARSIEVGLFAREKLSQLAPATIPRRDLIDLHTLAEYGESEYHRLLLANVRLVFHWAKPMANSVGIDWVQDAFQVGFIGLIRGIQGWDFTRGFTLSTYASWHIRQAIQRWRANETDLIRLPVHVTDKLKSAPHELSAQIQEAVARSRRIVPIDSIDMKEAGSHWDGGLVDVLESVFRRRSLDQILAELPEQECRVLRLRTGYPSDEEPKTLEEIGQIVGVTRERIRQIEKKALDRARKLLGPHA